MQWVNPDMRLFDTAKIASLADMHLHVCKQDQGIGTHLPAFINHLAQLQRISGNPHMQHNDSTCSNHL